MHTLFLQIARRGERRGVVVARRALSLSAVAVTLCLACARQTLPAAIPRVDGEMQTQYAMRYIDVAEGTGLLAEPGKVYSVHYTGWLRDGTKFDSSRDRGVPFTFEQGKRRVIAGWESGFEGMRVGGKRRLFIPYQLAYGEKARSKIPPKAELIFDVELLDVTAPPPPPDTLKAPAKK